MSNGQQSQYGTDGKEYLPYGVVGNGRLQYGMVDNAYVRFGMGGNEYPRYTYSTVLPRFLSPNGWPWQPLEFLQLHIEPNTLHKACSQSELIICIRRTLYVILYIPDATAPPKRWATNRSKTKVLYRSSNPAAYLPK